MLRIMPNQEPVLVRLCRMGSWEDVERHVALHSSSTTSVVCSGTGTALSNAVRSGAPVKILHALLQINPHQIGMTSKYRGSVLHEAIKHRVSCHVVGYLLHRTIQYQHQYQIIDAAEEESMFQFRHERIQDHNRLIKGPALLAVQDHLGQTVLHQMVELLVDFRHAYPRAVLWTWFHTLIHAYPDACLTLDADGNTPLITLLSQPIHGSKPLEAEIYRALEVIVSLRPRAVILARKTLRTWRFHSNVPSSVAEMKCGGVSATPLYFAVLYGRDLSTIRLLIDTNRQLGVNGSACIVTAHHETCLHVAVTTRAPLALLAMLIADAPHTIAVADTRGWTPLDWLWIRHVLDWHGIPEGTQRYSRRRFLPMEFKSWYRLATANIPASATTGLPNQGHDTMQALQLELLGTLRLMLPVAAQVQFSKEQGQLEWCQAVILGSNGPTHKAQQRHQQLTPWSLLHAACYVPCPLGVVRLVWHLDNAVSNRMLRKIDNLWGRTPLHYAAGRANFELDTLSTPLQELLPHFPSALNIVDANHQLPLHIAIESGMEMEVILGLLKLCPDSLERRDGKTKLYPWQMNSGDINLTYKLLELCPAVLTTFQRHVEHKNS